MPLDGGMAPLGADRIVRGEEGGWEAAAQPELLQGIRVGAGFADVESADLQRDRAAKQRLALVHHAWCGTAQQQVLAIAVHAIGPVHQHAQRLWQSWQVLDFVDHDQAVQARQRAHRVNQALTRERVFEVEVLGAGDVDELA